MSAFPALALALALTYLLGDLYRPYVPKGVGYMIDLALCALVFRFTYRYLKNLKD